MKKVLISIICGTSILLMTATGLAFNKAFFDFEYTFERAIIKLPNGEIVDGEVDTWKDFQKDNHVQIKMKTGVTYLVDKVNVALIHMEK